MTAFRTAPLDVLLPRLRCPDCAGEALAVDAPISGNVDSRAIRCDACGRVLEMEGNLLSALPKALAQGGEANLDHYDEISASDENELSRRSRTRNHRTKIQLVLDRLGLNEADREGDRAVLEIGAGSGAHGAAIVETGSPYVGLDLSAGFLSHAPKRHPALRDAALVAADATHTPFRDNAFDAAFAVGTIHHLPDPEQGIREIIRVLAPNGRFCFVEPKRFYPAHFVKAIWYAAREISAMKMSVRNLTNWLRDAGATEIEASFAIYTPNGPTALVPVWDVVDRVCDRLSFLHPLSVMFCMHGRK